MQRQVLSLCAAVLFAIVMAAPATAQRDKSQRPSPPAKAECNFADGKKLTIDYSSPRMKGRQIYGGLVPFEQVWRTGANEATTFVTDGDLVVGGKPVTAGSYTLFTIPNPDKWTLIISKKTGEWGIPYPGEADDLLRTDAMKVSSLPAPLENLTISFKAAGNTCQMQVDWESARASIEISRKK